MLIRAGRGDCYASLRERYATNASRLTRCGELQANATRLPQHAWRRGAAEADTWNLREARECGAARVAGVAADDVDVKNLARMVERGRSRPRQLTARTCLLAVDRAVRALCRHGIRG